MDKEFLEQFEDLKILNRKKSIMILVFNFLYILCVISGIYIYLNNIGVSLKTTNLELILTPTVASYIIYGFVKMGFINTIMKKNKIEIENYINIIIRGKFKDKIKFESKRNFYEFETTNSLLFQNDFNEYYNNKTVVGRIEKMRFKGGNIKMEKITDSGKSKKTEGIFDGLLLKFYLNNKFKNNIRFKNKKFPFKINENHLIFGIILLTVFTKNFLLLLSFILALETIKILKKHFDKHKKINKNLSFEKIYEVSGEDTEYSNEIKKLIGKDILKLRNSSEVPISCSCIGRYFYVAIPNRKILEVPYNENFKHQLDNVFDLIEIINGSTKIASILENNLPSINENYFDNYNDTVKTNISEKVITLQEFLPNQIG